MATRLALQRLSLATARAPSAFRPKSLSPFASVTKVRTMASSTSKHEYLVIVPDKAGVLEKRLAVRPKHFEGLKAPREDGFIKMGGALLNSIPKDDSPSSLDFHGSTLVVSASSKEEILERLSQDIYVKEGVWDLEKIQIFPFKCAFRDP